MRKKYSNKNVYEASMERIAYLFDSFENILVAVSGGKDSAVCLNLCYDYAKKHNMLNKLALYHLDYEAQYELTTEFVERIFLKNFEGIRKFWLCLPVGANCGCNMEAGTWTPWEKSKEEIWCRKMPKNKYVINEDNVPFKMFSGQKDYDVQDNFAKYFSKTYGSTAVVIGIRTDESLNRFRALVKDSRVNVFKNKNYILGYGDNRTYKAYPIYDWATEDIWVANYKFNYDYNKIYDLYYQAGLGIHQMRVANPFHSCGIESLKLYRVIEPKTWAKLLGRVNGVNFAGIYGGTTAMGWKSITLPKGHTWKSYLNFLLNTLPDKVRNNYIEKFQTSIKFWKEKGGALSEQTVKELNEIKGLKFTNKGATSKITSKEVVTFEDYPDDLQEVTNFKEVPSYKRMCVCIMKNDYFCQYMGFAPPVAQVRERKRILEMYKNL